MRIQSIDKSDYRQVLQLKVLPSQQDFIENTVECLKNAEETNMCRVVSLYDEDKMVGFGMYGFLPNAGENGQAWLENFMIDCSYQGHGYGEKALNLLLAAIEEEYKCNEIYLSVHPSNSKAIWLYMNHGFEFNGEINQYNERVMVKKVHARELAGVC